MKWSRLGVQANRESQCTYSEKKTYIYLWSQYFITASDENRLVFTLQTANRKRPINTPYSSFDLRNTRTHLQEFSYRETTRVV